MAKTQTVNLEVNSNLDQTTKQVTSLKAELRKAQAEVAAMAEEFGATSKQAIEAAKRAAELKDQIGDAKALTEAFNPEAKFKALAGAANIAAGALSGFEGAMGLVGVQSEEAQAAILKVQSALALSQGLDVLQEIPDTFKNIKAVAIDAFNGIKGAIGATGIGLLVVALGTLVTYWDDIKKAVTGATKETEAYQEANKSVADTLSKTYQDLTTVKNAIDNAKKGILSKTEALKIYNEKLGDALGKTDSLEAAEKRMEKYTTKYVESQIARANAQFFIAKASELAAKKASGEGTDISWWQTLKTEATKAILGVGAAAEANAKYITENSKEASEQIKFYNDLAVNETIKADKISTEINAEGINKKYEKNKEYLEALKQLRKEELNDIINNEKISFEERRKIVNESNLLTKIEKKQFLKELSDLEKQQREEDAKALKESYKRSKEDDDALRNEITQAISDAQEKQSEFLVSAQEAEEQKVKDKYFRLLELAKQQGRSIEEINALQDARDNELNDIRFKNQEENAKKQLAMEQAIADGKKAIQESTLSNIEGGIGLLKGLFEKNKVIQKGLILAESAVGIARVINNTSAADGADAFYAAQMGPVAGPPYLASKKVLNRITAGISIASNLAATTKALSALGGGGAGSKPSMDSGGGAAPRFNVVGNAGVNQIAETMNRQAQSPIQAYVVANNVTTAQSLNRNIVQNASLG